MEPFITAAVSLAISVTLITKRKTNYLHLLFAALCFALFADKIGLFLSPILGTAYWRGVHYVGTLSIPPLLIMFARASFGYRTFLAIRDIIVTVIVSVMAMLAFLTPLLPWFRHDVLLSVYNGGVAAYCFVALLSYIGKEQEGPFRVRMIAVAVAVAITALCGMIDLIGIMGHRLLPPLFDIAVAVLIYFVFITITNPDLYEWFGTIIRSLSVVGAVLISTLFFYSIMALANQSTTMSFSGVFIVLLFIVILIDPIKDLLRAVVNHFIRNNEDLATVAEMGGVSRQKDHASLEEMATGLAHEIRNPLGSIKGAAQYLKADGEASGTSKLLNIIIEETDRLNSVVSQFLNYARPHTFNVEKQDINRIVHKVVSLVKAKGVPSGITIEEHLAADLPGVKIDGEQMLQVLLNIALNGIEAMPDGGTLRFGTVRIVGDGRRKVEIAIADTGQGISAKDRREIFKPFYTTKKRGTGLGLSICHKIVKNHGGTIRVESSPARGTTFFIRL
jgi:signal transduction histidine kinase